MIFIQLHQNINGSRKMNKNHELLKIANQYLHHLLTNNHEILVHELHYDIVKLDKEWNIINPYYDEKFADFPMILIKCEWFYHHQTVAYYHLYFNQDAQFLDEFFTVLSD